LPSTLREVQIVIKIWRYHYDTIGALALLGFRPPAFEAFVPDFPALRWSWKIGQVDKVYSTG